MESCFSHAVLHILPTGVSRKLIELQPLSLAGGEKAPKKAISLPFFLKKNIYLFIFGCVGSSFSVRGLSLVTASGGHSSSRCAGLSLSRPLLLRGTGSRRAGSVIVAHGPSRSAACGIFPDQGSNPCTVH